MYLNTKAYFFEFSSPVLVVAIFLISGFYLIINYYVFDHSNFPDIIRKSGQKAVVLFQLYVPVFAKQGIKIKIGETVLGLFYLKPVFNGQYKELKVVAKVN